MKVSILACDGCMGAEVFGCADILLVANRISAFRRPSEPPPFECKIVSAERSCVTLAGGWILQPSSARLPDLLIVPAFDFMRSGDIDGIVSRMPRTACGSRTVAGRPESAPYPSLPA
jgi:hypothetical protein